MAQLPPPLGVASGRHLCLVSPAMQVGPVVQLRLLVASPCVAASAVAVQRDAPHRPGEPVLGYRPPNKIAPEEAPDKREQLLASKTTARNVEAAAIGRKANAHRASSGQTLGFASAHKCRRFRAPESPATYFAPWDWARTESNCSRDKRETYTGGAGAGPPAFVWGLF
eukprot:GHVT01006322.1.p1 GENE.GHVT01006322.1~~GHVT01006322.1.p1  ORF type:complete len:179 (+),score=26.04 GHVT01006322.1:36-539(+)